MAKSQARASYALLDRMRAAVDNGLLSEAADIFDRDAHSASADMGLLRAWIYFKTRAYSAAIEFLNGPRFRDLTPRQQAERYLLLAVTNSQSNRFAEADEYFDRVAALEPHLLPDGDLAYWRGRRFLDERRTKEAAQQLHDVRIAAGDTARIHADLLESGVLAQQRRYLDAAVLLMHLLEFMDGLKDQHRETEVWTLHTLAVYARELDAPKIRRFVQSRVSRQEWPPDFSVNEFQTLKAAAWCHALDGDYFNAFRYLKMAGNIAPSTPWRAMTLLDRAYLAGCVGESLWSRSELAEAQALLEEIPWRETSDEERVALPLAAELLAPLDGGRASAYLTTFFGMRDVLNPQLHFRYDDRLRALAEYANAVVQMQLGNRKSALAALRDVWKIYDGIGYDWRAGRSALRLFELTGEARWRDRAREKLKNYAGSWLYDELRAKTASDAPFLHPAQKRVYDLLLEGNSTEQIAKITGRSPFTISNQVKAILRAFGVPNRGALLADAMKRGPVSGTRRRK